MNVNKDFLSDEVKTNNTKPFLKWAGGKFRIINHLKTKFNKKAKRYIEPFLGAGSVALNVEYQDYIVNDCCEDLVFVWQTLKNNGMEFIKNCQELFVPENNTDEQYYHLRNEFNNTKNKLRKAVLFVYLNRHCYNGLCRYNSSGKFNTPKGSYRAVYFPFNELINSLNKINKFKIYNFDFRKIFDLVEGGDMVYCDPPYLPMSQSANFDSYSEGGFSLQDQIDLAKCAEQAANKGATVVVSNHYNWYSVQIYTKMVTSKISKIEVARTISAKITTRDPVTEIIAIFN